MVRRARPDEAAAIHDVLVRAFTPFRAHYTEGCFDATVLDAGRIEGRMTEGPVWVAGDDELVGTIGARLDGDRLYVRGLGVVPEARGQGLGHRLLDACRDHAMDLGCTSMWLSTTPFLHASQALYEHDGFRPCDGPADLHGTPLVSWERPLR